MIARLAGMASLILCLGGCCAGTGCLVQTAGPVGIAPPAWDGLAQAPDRRVAMEDRGESRPAHASKQRKETSSANKPPAAADKLAGLKPYSKEWVAAYNKMNEEEDERLSRMMVICRGCLAPKQTAEPPHLASDSISSARSAHSD